MRRQEQTLERTVLLFERHGHRQHGSGAEQNGNSHHAGKQRHDAFQAAAGFDEEHARPGQRERAAPS